MPAFIPSSLPDLSSKVYLVTGGNTGIGYEAVLHLARKNATVYLGCRSSVKGATAIESIHKLVPEANISLLILDHMDFSSIVSAVKEFTRKEPKLHGLINNAGIMAIPFEKSKDGWESQWQTNYLAHFLLTQHLLPTLLATAKVSQPGVVRIINVSSGGHARFAPKVGIDFNDINQEKGGVWTRYGMSKLANVLHAKELNRLYGPNGTQKSEGEIWTASLNPGNINTNLSKNATFVSPAMSKPIVKILDIFGVFIPAEKGAYTTVYCAASDKFTAEYSGEYFEPLGKVGEPSKNGGDMAMAKKLWEWTEGEFRGKSLL